MKDLSLRPAKLENFLPVTVYEPHQCEHSGCGKLGLFGFLQRHQEHWFCYGHKDEGERQCRALPDVTN